jgi:hypothetical protein
VNQILRAFLANAADLLNVVRLITLQRFTFKPLGVG